MTRADVLAELQTCPAEVFDLLGPGLGVLEREFAMPAVREVGRHHDMHDSEASGSLTSSGDTDIDSLTVLECRITAWCTRDCRVLRYHIWTLCTEYRIRAFPSPVFVHTILPGKKYATV